MQNGHSFLSGRFFLLAVRLNWPLWRHAWQWHGNRPNAWARTATNPEVENGKSESATVLICRCCELETRNNLGRTNESRATMIGQSIQRDVFTGPAVDSFSVEATLPGALVRFNGKASSKPTWATESDAHYLLLPP